MGASIGKRGRIQAYGGLARQARPKIVQLTLAAVTGGCAAGLYSLESLLRIKPRLEPGYYLRMFDGRLRHQPYAVRPTPPLQLAVQAARLPWGLGLRLGRQRPFGAQLVNRIGLRAPYFCGARPCGEQ